MLLAELAFRFGSFILGGATLSSIFVASTRQKTESSRVLVVSGELPRALFGDTEVCRRGMRLMGGGGHRSWALTLQEVCVHGGLHHCKLRSRAFRPVGWRPLVHVLVGSRVGALVEAENDVPQPVTHCRSDVVFGLDS